MKHTIFARAERPRIVSLGIDTVIPSGNEEKGLGHGTAFFEPFISAGALLRDWYLQAQVKVELPVDPGKADRAFVYNAYLGRDTSMAARFDGSAILVSADVRCRSTHDTIRAPSLAPTSPRRASSRRGT